MENYLRKALDRAHDCIFIFDAESLQFGYVNEGATRQIGYSADELLQMTALDIKPNYTTESFDELIAPLRSGVKAQLHFETVHRHRDGTLVPVEIALHHHEPPGQRARFVAIVRDITERRATEERLAEQRAELEDFQRALDQAHDCIFIFDAETLVFSYVNEGATKQVGYSVDELLQMTPLDIKPHHTRESFAELIAPLLSGAEAQVRFETIHRHRSGLLVPVDIAVHYQSREGRRPRFVAIVRDITERKATEERLAAQRRELEAAARIDRIASRIMLAFNRGTDEVPADEILNVLADEAGYRPLGFYEYDEWHGALVLAAKLGLSAERAGRSFAVGEGLVGEAAQRRRAIFVDGHDRELSLDTGTGVLPTATLFAIPIVHADNLLGVLTGASHVSLTERERAWLEQTCTQVAVGLHALRQYQELRELSSQLNERTRHIESQNEALARASRLKSEFLASMSHELRTPLNAIIGFSEVLKDGVMGDLEDGHLDYVTEIFEAGQHLLSLINDVLDLSKIEAGKEELELEDVLLGPLVENAITIIKERATKGDLSLFHSVAPGLESVRADGRKLRQILYNLLSNAVKFTPEGGSVRVEVRQDGAEVELSVIDTGIGIAPEDQERLFRSFEQLESGIDRRYEGTGLGLVLVKNLVELHGGRVGVESHPGEGSRFWVRLPGGQRGGRDEASRPMSPLEGGGPHPISTSDHDVSEAAPRIDDLERRILVVDDDPRARKLLRLYLEDAGFVVTLASDGEEALVKLAEKPHDLVTLDLAMPGMDGISLLGQLSTNPAFRGIPVLIVSGTDTPERALSLGAQGVLCKPIRRHELLDSVRRVVPKKEERRPRVLLVDDDPKAIKIITSYFVGEPIDVDYVYGGRDALGLIYSWRPDLVVLDLMMPEVSGFDVLVELRSRPETIGLPVIILTAKELAAMDRGRLARSAQVVLAKASTSRSDFIEAARRLLAPGSAGAPRETSR